MSVADYAKVVAIRQRVTPLSGVAQHLGLLTLELGVKERYEKISNGLSQVLCLAFVIAGLSKVHEMATYLTDGGAIQQVTR